MCKISKNEIKQFALLNQRGLDTQTMIELSFKDAKKIIAGLEKGIPLPKLLCSAQKDTYFQTLYLLCQSLSFDKAIQTADALDKVQSELKTKILRALAYPAFLFVFSYGMIVFFSSTIIPSLMTYDSSLSSMGLVRALQIGYSIVFILIFLLIGCILFRKKLRRVNSIIFSIPVIQDIVHYSFSLVWLALLESGCSTQACISIMTNIPSTRHQAGQIQSQLEKGFSLVDSLACIFGGDDLFMRCIHLGISSSNLLHILPIYQTRVYFQIEQRIKHCILGIQLLSYSSVAILVFVFYQVLLLPLNLLQSF